MLASESQRLFERLMLLTGRLNYVWTNTESLLIHLIAGLSGADKEVAAVVFLTLNTTRARIDLVERLAKLERRAAGERDEVLDCTRALASFAAVRNRFNHCIYSLDPDNGGMKTIMMRIADRRADIRMGRADPIDTTAIELVERTLDELAALNRRMWELIARHGYPL